MSWNIFLTIAHIVGTVLGVGGATFAEIFYMKAMKDGHVDPTESDFLKTSYRVLRIGMILLILSGFGYFLLFRIEGKEFLLYNDRFLAKVWLTIIIFFNALLIQTRKIPLWLGGALSITSWYAALVLGIWRGIPASLFAITLWYIAAVLVVALILHVIRKAYLKAPPQIQQ
ncbi:MAG: hypothetical protein NUV61_04045 [Candidatus Azambacteria bacterium]|nr:hypothetical protein [Candidatus Azambacteria bacterium]